MGVGAAPALALSADCRCDAAVQIIARMLSDSGLEDARREARFLVQAALGFTAAQMMTEADQPVGPAAARLQAMALARAARVPFARITGNREFFGLDFSLSPATLVPRPDTETLVEAMLEHARSRDMHQRAISIVDLGTGSGAILTALLVHLPLATGIGVDLSAEARATAEANFARHCEQSRARFVTGHWMDGLVGPFDIIVSNPPYIPTADLPGLAPEVREHDPVLALDGGSSGLDAYRALAQAIPGQLAPGGFAGVELGIGQADDVRVLMERQGLRQIECRADLGGIPRALLCEKP